jgi:DNA ligase-associated metallophosphoesterase
MFMNYIEKWTSANWCEEELLLLPWRAVFWKRESMLLVADLHLGKVNHFRKSGIPVPVKANDQNIANLLACISQTQPKRVVFLGDLFHSHYNQEWEVFGEVTHHFSYCSFELVLGNHDILSAQQYVRKKIIVHTQLEVAPFTFTHHPVDKPTASAHYISGHVHPGVRLSGKGRQGITLPCFYFGARQALLPAFGTFTGLARIQPKEGDRIFAIVNNQKIIAV